MRKIIVTTVLAVCWLSVFLSLKAEDKTKLLCGRCLSESSCGTIKECMKALDAEYVKVQEREFNDSNEGRVRNYPQEIDWIDDEQVRFICGKIDGGDIQKTDIGFELYFLLNGNYAARRMLAESLAARMIKDPENSIKSIARLRSILPQAVTDGFFYAALSDIICGRGLRYENEEGYRIIKKKLMDRAAEIKAVKGSGDDDSFNRARDGIVMQLDIAINDLRYTRKYRDYNPMDFSGLKGYGALAMLGYTSWEMIADDRWWLAVAMDTMAAGLLLAKAEDKGARDVGSVLGILGLITAGAYPFYAVVECYINPNEEQRMWAWIGVLVFIYAQLPFQMDSANRDAIYESSLVLSPVFAADYSGLEASIKF